MSDFFDHRLQANWYLIERLLHPRTRTPRLGLEMILRGFGHDEAFIAQELLRRFGEVTDEERALERRISRESAIIAGVTALFGVPKGCTLLADRIEDVHGGTGSYLRDLDECELEIVEAWVNAGCPVYKMPPPAETAPSVTMEAYREGVDDERPD